MSLPSSGPLGSFNGEEDVEVFRFGVATIFTNHPNAVGIIEYSEGLANHEFVNHPSHTVPCHGLDLSSNGQIGVGAQTGESFTADHLACRVLAASHDA